MHDIFLLHKISEEISQICSKNNIKKLNKLTIIVNDKSHVNEKNLFEHLQYANKGYIGAWTNILVERGDVQDQTSILQSIEGEKSEE